MKAENHVPTLETCRKLDDAGIKFDTYFNWFELESVGWKVGGKGCLFEGMQELNAPTTQELLGKMPPHIKKDGWLGIQPLRIEFGFGECEVTYGINGSKAVNTHNAQKPS